MKEVKTHGNVTIYITESLETVQRVSEIEEILYAEREDSLQPWRAINSKDREFVFSILKDSFEFPFAERYISASRFGFIGIKLTGVFENTYFYIYIKSAESSRNFRLATVDKDEGTKLFDSFEKALSRSKGFISSFLIQNIHNFREVGFA